MITPKIFLPVLFLLLINDNIDCKEIRIKYNQTAANFLDTNLNNISVSIKDAVDYANMLMEGDVVKAERKFKKDSPFWKIDLITVQKGIIEFEISVSKKEVMRLDADEGPFDYEIKPESSPISFSAAKKAAEDFTGQKILKWNYFKNKDSWEYDFWLFTKSGKAQVRIDAETGEIISSRKKKN